MLFEAANHISRILQVLSWINWYVERCLKEVKPKMMFVYSHLIFTLCMRGWTNLPSNGEPEKGENIEQDL